MSLNRWLPILGGLYLIGALLNLPFLTSLSATLIILLGIMALWRRYALVGVIYHRRPFYRRAFPGERVELRIEVENRKPLPLSWLRVEDPWPKAVGPEDPELLAPSHIPDQGILTNVFSLRWFERARRRYMLLFRDRGVYRVGPARLISGDFFGMQEISAEAGGTTLLTVFPRILPPEELDLPAEDPFGARKSKRRIFEDPNLPVGVRDYRPEDGFRRVHWPATARTGRLQVKVYQPAASQVAVLCLNVATFERHWEGVYPELLEHLVSLTATLAQKFIHDGYQVGLISNGSLAHADRPFRIPPGRSPRQLGRMLSLLAGVTPLVMKPFAEFLVQEMPRVYYGASLLVISAVVSAQLRETLARLHRHGRRITLYSLAQEPPGLIPGVLCLHRPFRPQGVPVKARGAAD